jgi:hypothetical protein
MKTFSNEPNKTKQQAGNGEENNLPGYPNYPAEEDIFNNYMEEKDINPENIFSTEEFPENYSDETNNPNNYHNDVLSRDLDIPGSELDDNMEIIGCEDEENNYYSLGGDDHDDLEEDHGE